MLLQKKLQKTQQLQQPLKKGEPDFVKSKSKSGRKPSVLAFLYFKMYNSGVFNILKIGLFLCILHKNIQKAIFFLEILTKILDKIQYLWYYKDGKRKDSKRDLLGT